MSGPTGTSETPESIPTSSLATDPFSSSWLSNFNPSFQSFLSGTGTNSSSVQTTSTSSSVPFSSFLDKSFVSFDSALDVHLKNGGEGTTFYNPVMHYDLETTGYRFNPVDKVAGIYERDGVFYATVPLGGKSVLQPVGIADGKAQGLSKDLSPEQAALMEKFMGGIRKIVEEGMSPEDAQKKVMDKVKEGPEAVEKWLKESETPAEGEGSSPPTTREAENGTHDGT